MPDDTNTWMALGTIEIRLERGNRHWRKVQKTLDIPKAPTFKGCAKAVCRSVVCRLTCRASIHTLSKCVPCYTDDSGQMGGPGRSEYCTEFTATDDRVTVFRFMVGTFVAELTSVPHQGGPAGSGHYPRQDRVRIVP
jgi:hypothetical protein